MRTHLASVIGLSVGLLVLGLVGRARAEVVESARATGSARDWGLSVGAGLSVVGGDAIPNSDPERDHRVTSGLLSLAVVGNLGQVALGTSVEGVPSLIGNGHMAAGLLAGWQRPIGRARLQLLAEVGEERFWELGSFFTTIAPDNFSTPYVGARLGVTTTFSRDGHFEGGISLFARHDLRRGTVTLTEDGFFGGPTTSRTYEVGGDVVGVSLRLGFRLEGPLPSRSSS